MAISANGLAERRCTETGFLLQHALAALATRRNFREDNNQTGLVTGHLAGCLAIALTDTRGWDETLLAQAQNCAHALLDRDIKDWFSRTWATGGNSRPTKCLSFRLWPSCGPHTFPAPSGIRSGDQLEERAADVLRTWCWFRTGPEKHIEGTGYDGYLFDSVTEWLAASPARDEILKTEAAAFRSLADLWIDLTSPGRVDLHAPLGDVEADAIWEQRPCPFMIDLHVARRRMAVGPFSTSTISIGSVGDSGRAHGIFPSHFHLQILAPDACRGQPRSAPAGVRKIRGRGQPQPRHDGTSSLRCWTFGIGLQGRAWIPDPGYQQYKPIAERDCSRGTRAHSAPFINDVAQKFHAARPAPLSDAHDGTQSLVVDMARALETSTECVGWSLRVTRVARSPLCGGA